VTATNGAIGYVSPDFTKMAPTNPTGPITANLQDEWDVSTNVSGTPTFVAATVAATTQAMSSVTPVFDSTSIGNPLAWSLQGVVPNPVLQGAYPLAGFSWIEMYQCYNSGNNMPVQLNNFLYSLYAGGAHLGGIINSNGFAVVPNVWQTQIFSLLGNATYAPSNTSAASCSGKVGAT
jgi:phosphate transport system substrate-binding protein